MKTKLLYMRNMTDLTCDAQVVSIELSKQNNMYHVVLDQTVFYPQGGGQPYDIGIIKQLKPNHTDMVFFVKEVRCIDGIVVHIGMFDSEPGVPTPEQCRHVFQVGDLVVCSVDQERRAMNSRIHSAGHLIDLALKKLNIDWKPVKGYHFSDGPYVEYMHDQPVVMDGLMESLQVACDQLIASSIDTYVTFEDGVGPQGKELRTVWFGDFGIPCGGTHVDNLSSIGILKIRKIKQSGRVVKVSYAIE